MERIMLTWMLRDCTYLIYLNNAWDQILSYLISLDKVLDRLKLSLD